MAATAQHARRVLGLDDQATFADIRRIRREMALKYHPDVSINQTRAAAHMARINAAADTLTAHLRELDLQHHTGKSPIYPDFSNPTASQASSQPTKTGPLVPIGHVPSAPAIAPSRTPKPAREAPKNDNALARFASTSYERNLIQIGESAPVSTINVKVLKFS